MQTEVLNVTGMTCGGCTRKVTHALETIGGVHEVVVYLDDGSATVQFEESRTSTAELKVAVEHAGYGVTAIGTGQSKHTPANGGGGG